MTQTTLVPGAGTSSDEPIIRIRGLTKDFQLGGIFSRRHVRALHAVDLEVHRGEIVALVGESGSGKSTIARCLARLETPTAGDLLVDGQDVWRARGRHASRAYRSTVQMIFQDPFGSLNPAHRVGDVLTRPLLVHRRAVGHEAVRTRLSHLMAEVGLSDELLDAYPHELSGGQRQRVSVARALAVEPQIIVADEPTSMLDVSVRLGILNLLRRLRDERGITVIYITHDLASARYLADTTNVMYAGELVEGGESLTLMATPRHPYTRLLLSAVPDPTHSVPFDADAHTRLRAAVHSGEECPYSGDPDRPCSRTHPARHVVDNDHGAAHWVRCLRYAPASAPRTNGST